MHRLAASAALKYYRTNIMLSNSRRRLRPIGMRGAASVASPGVDRNEVSGLFRLLTDEQRGILLEQRNLVQRVQSLGSQVDGVEVIDCRGGLGDLANELSTYGSGIESSIDSTFLVVIAGEFNAGKSTLVNALLGDKLLDTGPLPTTAGVEILAYDSSAAANGAAAVEKQLSHTLRSGVVLYRHPSALLRDLTLIDTPGTNAVHADHTNRTAKLLPVADLILFVTSADRPFPESERLLLRSIQTHRKNVVIVLNKIDVLDASGGDHGQKEKDRVTTFVAEHAADLLGRRPVVLPVSARDALASKSISPGGRWADTSVWKRSNFDALEQYLSMTLTDRIKMQSKLLNPLGVAEGIIDKSLVGLKTQSAELENDVATLRLLETQMKGWIKELEADTERFRFEAGEILRAEGNRCSTLITRMGYKEQWKWTVLGDGPEFDALWTKASMGPSSIVEVELLDLVREAADHVATKSRAQGQAVIEYLGKRPAMTSHSLVGSVTAASRFEDTRKELEEKMYLSVSRVLCGLDPEAERQTAKYSFRDSAIISGALQAGAFAVGAISALGEVDPIIGIPSATILVAFGSAVVPFRNRSVARNYQKEWDDRRDQLMNMFDSIFAKETQRIEDRILNGISPYTRYVKTYQERTERLQGECESLSSSAQRLRSRINKMTS